MKTVATLRDGVAGLLTGTNLDNVTNLYGAFERALRTLLQKASIPEASTGENITLYDGVYDYTSPSSIFGGALRDIRPIGISRLPSDYVYKQPIELFDRTKALLPNGYAATFETVNGVNLMRIANTRATKRITLDGMNSATGWTAGGSASTPVADSSFFYQSPASLRFNLAGASSGTLTKTLTNSVDLTTYQGVGVVFLALELPDPATSLTSLELRIGSSATKYYSLSVTEGFLGAWVSGDFLLVAFDLADASVTATAPTITAMNYLRLSFTHGATMTNVRVGGIFISLPSPHKIFYESTAVFQLTGGGAISNSITNNNDIILLNDAAYNLYEHECAIACMIQMGGSLGTGVTATLNATLNGARAKNGTIIAYGLYDRYRADNPSEELRQIGNYYLD